MSDFARILALAVILQAQRDAAKGDVDAITWLCSPETGFLCDLLGISQGEILRRAAERAAHKPGSRRHYVG